MDISLDRDALLNALGTVHRITPKKPTIPVLGNVLLDAGPLTVTATDCDMMGIAVMVGQAGAARDRITVPAHMLHDIARKLPPGGSITVRLDKPDGPLVLACGRSRFILQTLPAEDFPDLAVGDMTHSFSMPGRTLASMIDACEFAISTEATRYYLNGIYVHAVGGTGGPRLRFVTTDGHRLAQIDTEAPEGTEGMPGIIVPRFFVSEMRRLAEATETVEISLSTVKIRISNGNGSVLLSKLIEGTFPDYERVIPAGNDRTVVIERAELTKAIERILTIETGNTRAVKFVFEGDTLCLTHRNENADTATEEIEVAHEGDCLEVGFNGRYILDILGAVGGERVVMKLDNAGAPGLILSEEDPNRLYVCMPMRV